MLRRQAIMSAINKIKYFLLKVMYAKSVRTKENNYHKLH